MLGNKACLIAQISGAEILADVADCCDEIGQGLAGRGLRWCVKPERIGRMRIGLPVRGQHYHRVRCISNVEFGDIHGWSLKQSRGIGEVQNFLDGSFSDGSLEQWRQQQARELRRLRTRSDEPPIATHDQRGHRREHRGLWRKAPR